MNKKNKKAKRITKQAQVRVKTGVKSGDSCRSDADCPPNFYCIDKNCISIQHPFYNGEPPRYNKFTVA